MASYTGDQLSGAGTPIEALNASTAYTFSISPSSNLSGSSYFTFETVRNSNGYYDSSSALNAVGDFSSLTNVQTLVSSSYIFSLVVEEGGGSFVFTPSNNVLVSGSFLRTTGGSSLVISGFPVFVEFFNNRVEADGGVVESLQCVSEALSSLSIYNWDYYFRVESDGGVVESLECVII